MENTAAVTADGKEFDTGTLDKECGALSALFQQIINEMKVSVAFTMFQLNTLNTLYRFME